MSRKIFFFLALCLSSSAYSQTCKIIYSYDQSGNRITRDKNCPTPLPDSPAPMAAQAATATTADGVNTFDNSSSIFSAYPNPTYGIINVSLANFENSSYQLYDILGKQIQQGNFISSQLVLDISNEGNGQYILRIISNGQSKDYKIIKKS